MRYLRTEKLRSFHLQPFIVLTIAKRAHYKEERERTCSVNVLKLVSPNQPDLQQLWGQSTSKRVRGGISFLKTVNTLKVALQMHKGGDGLVRVRVRVRVQIHQHDTQGQRTSAEFRRIPFYHCIGRHLYLFPYSTFPVF